MKTFNFYKYLPKRFFTVNPQYTATRKLVYAFKDGEKWATRYVADIVANLLLEWYGDKTIDIVLVCAPCANQKKYNYRFMNFAADVTRRTRIQNGSAHVNIFGCRESKHRNALHIVSESFGYTVNLDADFFKGKRVIVFDDLITSGATAEEFKEQLEVVGATVLGGLFLARTVHSDGIRGAIKEMKYKQYNAK